MSFQCGWIGAQLGPSELRDECSLGKTKAVLPGQCLGGREKQREVETSVEEFKQLLDQ